MKNWREVLLKLSWITQPSFFDQSFNHNEFSKLLRDLLTEEGQFIRDNKIYIYPDPNRISFVFYPVKTVSHFISCRVSLYTASVRSKQPMDYVAQVSYQYKGSIKEKFEGVITDINSVRDIVSKMISLIEKINSELDIRDNSELDRREGRW
jgi:hypothetical protein